MRRGESKSRTPLGEVPGRGGPTAGRVLLGVLVEWLLGLMTQLTGVSENWCFFCFLDVILLPDFYMKELIFIDFR